MSGMPSRVTFLVPAVVCLAVATVMIVQIARPLGEPRTWTPLATAPDLDQARSDVEIWLDGEPLQDMIASGELTRASAEPTLQAGDFRVRVNSAARIGRVQMLLLAVTATAGLTLLLVSFAIPRRRSRPAADLGDPETVP